jgi:hypothetical protein
MNNTGEIMKAQASADILVECVEDYAGVSFLTIRLHGTDHYSMYKEYAGLPRVLTMDGKKYGKSCWDSDKHYAYYRTDRLFASV